MLVKNLTRLHQVLTPKLLEFKSIELQQKYREKLVEENPKCYPVQR